MKLYEKIYTELKSRIASGEFDNGRLLPTEKALQEEFEVSRITVKQAYSKLCEEGLIVRTAGKGTVLADKKHTNDSKKLIGLILCDFDSTFGERLIKSIEENAQKQGYSIILKRSFDDHKTESKVLNELLEIGVNGIIIQNCHGDFTKNLIALSVQDFPLVSVDRYAKGLLIPSVTSDNFSASVNATELLMKKGHNQILFVSSNPKSTSTLTERAEGFKQAHINLGISLSADNFITDLKSPITKSNTDIVRDIDIIKRHINNNNITAIIAAERFAAELCAIAVKESRKSFPKDCEMICFDYENLFLSQSDYTHILQNEEEMGKVCIEQLIKKINKEETTMRNIINSKIILGNSTKNVETI
ncbi:MAG: GntR family transcriptional regulator [Clostridium sp.]|nr:GntR family transcriptional regulator [Clostridium sp.]